MIFVDASALAALILCEPRALQIAEVIDSDEPLFTSAIAIYEAAMAIARVQELNYRASHNAVMMVVERGGIEIAHLTEITAVNAMLAFERFGKGRHKAKLNMGDCFAYAVAKAHGGAILFVGNDFTHTDLPDALAAI
jgi:ribonuclease VapC